MIWRGLCRTLSRGGSRIVFFERDVRYSSAHRDLYELPGGQLELYQSWETVLSRAERQLADADVAPSCDTITFTDRRNDDSE